MEIKISATELSRNLSDILNRVRYRRERFVVERNGEPIATLAPTATSDVTMRDLIELIRALPPVDEDFGDDVEEMRAGRRPQAMPEWPSSLTRVS